MGSEWQLAELPTIVFLKNSRFYLLANRKRVEV